MKREHLIQGLRYLLGKAENGCGDHSCSARPAGQGGQRTNGGCRCKPSDFTDNLLHLASNLDETYGRRGWWVTENKGKARCKKAQSS